jgi:hypothetical protein
MKRKAQKNKKMNTKIPAVAQLNGKIPIEQFVRKAIERLRDPEKSQGIHTVFSGFNEAFRDYYGGLDPVVETKKLSEAGKIIVRPARQGVMIYLPGANVPDLNAKKTLSKMGL